LLAGTSAITPHPASAAVDTYLVFVETSQGQIKGASTFPGHEGWVEVNGASLGNLALTEENHAALQRATSGAGAGKVKFNPFSITKEIDSASPKFFQAAQRREPVVKVIVECASGQHITHRLTITGGTLQVKPAGPGKEAIIFVGGNVTYN
jgi:type VI protein secretion system component Hcp